MSYDDCLLVVKRGVMEGIFDEAGILDLEK